MQQFDLLREIFDLSRAQRRCIERDEIDRFSELMEERESILHQIQQLVVEEASLPENVVEFPGATDPAQDTLALDTVIRGILEHDRVNESLLAEKMDAIREELPRLRQGMRANAGYRTDVDEPGAFMNRVS